MKFIQKFFKNGQEILKLYIPIQTSKIYFIVGATTLGTFVTLLIDILL